MAQQTHSASRDNRAVSPVIAIILMVAVTVALTAVISPLVLSTSERAADAQEQTPEIDGKFWVNKTSTFAPHEFVLRLEGDEYGEMRLSIHRVNGPLDPDATEVRISSRHDPANYSAYEWNAHGDNTSFSLPAEERDYYVGDRVIVVQNNTTIAAWPRV